MVRFFLVLEVEAKDVERLKKFLRQALSQQAHRLKIQVGAPWEMLLSTGAIPLDDGLPTEEAYLYALFTALLPSEQDKVVAQMLAKGSLHVPQVGKILVIAQPAAPASLRLYIPPQGPSLFEKDWARLSATTSSVGTKAPDSIPLVSVLAGGAKDSSQPLILQTQSLETGTGLNPGSVLQARPHIGGFIPPFLASSAESPRVGVVVEQLPPNPRLAAAGAAPKPEIPAFGAPIPPAPILPSLAAPSDSLHSRSQKESPLQIRFDADATGDSGSSDGQNLVDAVLADMVKRRASDVHMTGGEILCMRVDGEIERIGEEPLDPQMMEAYLAPIIPARNLKELVEGSDTDFAYDLRGVGRFRVNVFRDKNGIGAVMRHIPSTILTAEKLGLAPAILRFCGLTKGLVLVTGPTGSGKSTTLAGMIDLINKTRSDHILTIEDPIEFVHPQQKCLVNQREVHKHTKSFARALKAALREDPDIILIGEMRDLETIAIAIETAETGHLVFGTLHTTTAVSTVDRIIDQFPADRQAQIRTMLASSLKGVVAQTLLKKKGGGRVAAHEILVVSDPVSAMIREGKNHMIPNHMQTQKADGNQLLNEALSKLVKDGMVEPDDAMRKAVDKGTLADIFKRAGIKWGDAASSHTDSPRPAPKTA